MSADTIKRGRHEATPLPGLPRSEEEIAADPQPGDLYRTSWGYDQTNVEYFEVVKRTPGTVTVRRIASRMGDPDQGENPRYVYPAPGAWIHDVLMDGNSEIYDHDSNEWKPNPAHKLPYSEKVCRLATKASTKWGGDPRMGASLTIGHRHAWPYESGGAYDTIAAGEPGH
jgi:hypothetical protein